MLPARFGPTLEKTVQLLLSGGVPNPHLDPILQPADVSEQDIADLLAFLESLNEDCDGTAPELP